MKWVNFGCVSFKSMVHQRNQRILTQSGFFGFFGALWSEWFFINLFSKETQNVFSDYSGFKNPILDFLKETYRNWRHDMGKPTRWQNLSSTDFYVLDSFSLFSFPSVTLFLLLPTIHKFPSQFFQTWWSLQSLGLRKSPGTLPCLNFIRRLLQRVLPNEHQVFYLWQKKTLASEHLYWY